MKNQISTLCEYEITDLKMFLEPYYTKKQNKLQVIIESITNYPNLINTIIQELDEYKKGKQVQITGDMMEKFLQRLLNEREAELTK